MIRSSLHLLLRSSSTRRRTFVTQTFRVMMPIIDVPVPGMGDSITEGTIVDLPVSLGEAVKTDDVVVVLETDKVSVDVRSPHDGILTEVVGDLDSVVEVGQTLFKLDTDAAGVAVENMDASTIVGVGIGADGPVSGTTAPAPEASADAAEPVTVPVPGMGDSITEGTIVEMPVEPGHTVKADDVVVVLETDKVTVDVRAPSDGVVIEILGESGDVVEVGQDLFKMIPGAKGVEPSILTEEIPAPKAATDANAKVPVKTPPKEEVVSATPAKKQVTTTTPSPGGSPPKANEASTAFTPNDRTITRVKMSRMRQRVAERLKFAQNEMAMLTTFQECDMGNLIELRSKYKEDFAKKYGVKLGFMSAFVKAATAALQEIPAVNAYIDTETNEIVYHNYCDISIAVASPSGLVVPVLRSTEKMSFADVENQIVAYGKAAKEGTLAIEDMAGGTFTISNGGVFGSLMGTPIINPPQSAILGMHATKLRPVVDADGNIVARPMMYLALTYDHRLIDGREGVTFLKTIKEKIEDPGRLLLEV